MQLVCMEDKRTQSCMRMTELLYVFTCTEDKLTIASKYSDTQREDNPMLTSVLCTNSRTEVLHTIERV